MGKLSAFVALALGHSDIDNLYDRGMTPVLQGLGITHLRVDRIDHNEDIDDKIIQIIKDSHFCIADLTYARPSVYYEAGYAWGLAKPVIYTARADHLQSHSPRPQIDLRVHFDLQMKNIIPWSRPDSAFIRKFRARVRLVSRPILSAIRRQEVAKIEEDRFKDLAVSDQIAALTQKAWHKFSTAGFALEDLLKGGPMRRDALACTRVQNGRFQRVIFFAVPSITKGFLEPFELYALFKPPGDLSLSTASNHIVCASIRGFPRSKAALYLPNFRAVSGDVFTKGGSTPTYVHFIDGISSECDFNTRLAKTMCELELRRNDG